MAHPAIILDVDGVVLQWLPTFAGWMAERGFPPRIAHDLETDFRMSTMFPDAGMPRMLAEIALMSLDPRYGRMPFYPGVEATVSALRDAHPEAAIVAVTAAGERPETVAMRRANLSALALDDVRVLPLGARKIDEFRRFPKGSIVLEDVGKHVAEAEEAGHVGVLIHRTYNGRENVAVRVQGWDDFRRLVGERFAAEASVDPRR